MKIKKRILTLFLALCLVLPLVQNTTVDAAVKLNKTKISIYVGKTYTLKVSGTSKKVTWSSSKKSVATVSSKGVVKGVKAGTATITAKVSGKKYKCTVTVKKKVTTNYKTKVTYTSHKTDKNLVLIFKNSNTINVSISATVVYYDKKGNILDSKSGSTSIVQKNKSYVMTFYYPNYDGLSESDFASFKVNYTVAKASTFYKSLVSYVSMSSNISSATSKVNAEVVNSGTKTIKSMDLVCVYYKDGKVVGTTTSYNYNFAAGTSIIVTFNNPYDSNYNYLEYDKYKIYVNEAYTY